jgi:hypothetical protein
MCITDRLGLALHLTTKAQLAQLNRHLRLVLAHTPNLLVFCGLKFVWLVRAAAVAVVAQLLVLAVRAGILLLVRHF